MAITTDQSDSAYQAALQGVVFFDIRDGGVLRVEGPDQLAFLQRQTTNDVDLLSPSRSLVTVLVNPAARILDVLRLCQEGSGIDVLTLPGYAASTARFLKSRIFFMDKVSLQDLSQEYAQIELDGPNAGALLRKLGFEHAPELDEVILARFNEAQIRAIGRRGLIGKGYLLLAHAEQAQALQAALRAHQAEELSSEIYQILRLEAGLPGAGAELNEQYTPLEAGLAWTVAADKGCYTGQEIIARQVTYDKITQHLVGLHLEAAIPPGERLWAEGKPVGTATSVVASPTFGQIALAIVRRPYHAPGTTLTASAEPGDPGLRARVVTLPFRQQAPKEPA
ncbi:MAG TPA: glycine cleavage T C-terminal barrel domain-containing protein [Anaerolineales bacterium]|nr:glycine cleavage T C-terminal barrel domain-containing protein [Anaerolineales bacterium]